MRVVALLRRNLHELELDFLQLSRPLRLLDLAEFRPREENMNLLDLRMRFLHVLQHRQSFRELIEPEGLARLFDLLTRLHFRLGLALRRFFARLIAIDLGHRNA